MVETNKNKQHTEPTNTTADELPRDNVVGLYLGMFKAENLEAIDLAHEAGLIVSIVPTLPWSHPELMYNGREYLGMEAIRKALTPTQPETESPLV